MKAVILAAGLRIRFYCNKGTAHGNVASYDKPTLKFLVNKYYPPVSMTSQSSHN